MKKVLLCLGFALCGLLGVLAGHYLRGGSILPPNKEGIEIMVQDYADSIIFEHLNPIFCTATDVVVYRSEISDKMKEDSIFFGLPEKTLIDVATVCIKKTGYATKRSVVEEYRANRQVYNNLPNDTSPNTSIDSTTSSMEGSGVTKVNEPEKVIVGTDYKYTTDTIDGVPRRVLHKTETSYEK